MERMPPMSYLVAARRPSRCRWASRTDPPRSGAYRDQAVFSTAPAGSKTFTLNLADASGVHPLAAETRGEPVGADVSRGADGKPDDHRRPDPRDLSRWTRRPARAGACTRRTTSRAHPCSGATGSRGSRGATASTPRRSATRSKRVPTPRGTIAEIKLFGGRLAIALNSGATLGDEQVWCRSSTARAGCSSARSPAARPTGPSSAFPSTAARCTSRRSAPATRRAAPGIVIDYAPGSGERSVLVGHGRGPLG